MRHYRALCIVSLQEPHEVRLAITAILLFSQVGHSSIRPPNWLCARILGQDGTVPLGNILKGADQVHFSWLDLWVEVDIDEYAKMSSMPRFKLVAKIIRDFGVQVLFKGRELTLREFLRASPIRHWTSFSMLLATPYNDWSSLQRAHRFYATREQTDGAIGYYLAPGAEFINPKGGSVSGSSRPMGDRPIIVIEEDFDSEVMLHELTHHLIYLASRKTQALDEGYWIHTDWSKKWFDFSRQWRSAVEGSPDKEAIWNKMIRADFSGGRMLWREELAVNQFLLRHSGPIGLTMEQIERLLIRYFGDSQMAIHWHAGYISWLDQRVRRQRTDIKHEVAILRHEALTEIEAIKLGVSRFLDSSPRIEQLAYLLGLSLNR